ncbi:uncharacterized protein RJT21DRAFT_117651 [Scheffersomyces amazonensis]|uniref:uncharacterized protein n=1 Tax=Scheffersomyces amazonensis TaxID=1078765 RepID=UPI00315C8579
MPYTMTSEYPPHQTTQAPPVATAPVPSNSNLFEFPSQSSPVAATPSSGAAPNGSKDTTNTGFNNNQLFNVDLLTSSPQQFIMPSNMNNGSINNDEIYNQPFAIHSSNQVFQPTVDSLQLNDEIFFDTSLSNNFTFNNGNGNIQFYNNTNYIHQDENIIPTSSSNSLTNFFNPGPQSQHQPTTTHSSFSSISSQSQAKNATTPTINQVSSFQPITTPSMNPPITSAVSSNSSAFTSPQLSRHHSTSIPIDQLTLLTLKNLTDVTNPQGNSTNNPTPYQQQFQIKLSQQQQHQQQQQQQQQQQSQQTYRQHPAQQNLPSQSQHSANHISKSPSPDYYSTNSSISSVSTGPTSVGLPVSSTISIPSEVEEGHESVEIEKEVEAGTINPQKLFTTNSRIPMSYSSPSLSTLFQNGGRVTSVLPVQNQNFVPTMNQTNNSSNNNNVNSNLINNGNVTQYLQQQFNNNSSNFQQNVQQKYINLSNIPKLPNQGTNNRANSDVGLNVNGNLNMFDFKMNDECYNAISYWLNNNNNNNNNSNGNSNVIKNPEVFDEEDDEDESPTKLSIPAKGNGNRPKPKKVNSVSSINRRRNSIPVMSGIGGSSLIVNGTGSMAGAGSPIKEDTKIDSKKKRRKSSNAANEIIGPLGISEANNYNNNIDNNILQGQTVPLAFTSMASKSNGQIIDESIQLNSLNSTTVEPIINDSSPNISPTTTLEDSKASSNNNNNSIMQPNASGAFPCSECDKQFKRSEHLKRHIRSVHSNIRPFHCKFCEKKFSRSDNLAQHLKTHYRVDSTTGNTNIVYGNNPSSATNTKPLSSTKKK